LRDLTICHLGPAIFDCVLERSFQKETDIWRGHTFVAEGIKKGFVFVAIIQLPRGTARYQTDCPGVKPKCFAVPKPPRASSFPLV